MKKEDILNYVEVIKRTCGTNDPFVIAKYFNYKICFLDTEAAFIKANSYTSTIDKSKEIVINNGYDERSKMVLCAHEVAHCILGHPYKNNYKDKDLKKEYEANLFAVALLFEQADFNISFLEMPNYTLEHILESNITDF